MSLFPPADGARVFGLPPGADFTRALVDGLDARLAGAPPEALARVEIWVNTRRAARGLAEAYAAGPPRLLPRIRVVADLAADPRAPRDLAPPASRLGRKLELARLVGLLLRSEPGLAAESAAFDLADSLGELLDEMQGEGVPPDALTGLDAGEHAEHWRRSLRFLAILQDFVAASAPVQGQARMRAAAQALAGLWQAAPPEHPVIVAGSTGSRGATRAFMSAVARLPQGALVLPGFDADLPAAVWERLGADDAGAADHPQAGFRRLADALGFDPTTVPPWTAAAPPNRARGRLASLALRPAPVTDQWRSEGARLSGDLSAAMADVTWIEAEGLRAQARAIGWVLREAAERGERAALVTPDRDLARRVTAELSRWGMRPDDSAGRPLALTPPGVLLRRLSALIGAPLTPDALLSLLKHPLTASDPAIRRDHLRKTDWIELAHLRGGPPTIDWPSISVCAARKGADFAAWAAWLASVFDPLADDGPLELSDCVRRLRLAAERLAAGPDGGPHRLWDENAGAAALAVMNELDEAAAEYGPISLEGWRALFASEMQENVPEDAVVTHPGVAIWGTLEARVQSADLIVLGGLDEGVWPRLPGGDPWLSRLMRREIGLPSPERIVGLSAHDFQQAFAAPRVVLARATRDAEAPTVPSRWLLRLENLLAGLGSEGIAALAAARARGRAVLAASARLDQPAAHVPPARRPAPRPPVSAWPEALSVTQVERLVRDPYAIYALKVLGLRELDRLGAAPDALSRGSAIHDALDRFVTATAEILPPDAREVFLRETAAALGEAAPWPAVREFWIARLARVADWFVAGEVERRARATPLAREVSGGRTLHGLAQPLRITAKADRIDRAPGGSYAIYDYKSGGVPSASEARSFHLQLPLEAAIAAAGGFEGLPPGRAIHLELLGIGARKSLQLPPEHEETWDRLLRLIAAHQGPGLGFPARLRPQKLSYASEYDHLSRFGEWADGDSFDGEDIW